MKKLFISQPMRGKTNEEIYKERNVAIEKASELLGEPVEVIDSFFKDARGCIIEHDSAIAYGINSIVSLK